MKKQKNKQTALWAIGALSAVLVGNVGAVVVDQVNTGNARAVELSKFNIDLKDNQKQQSSLLDSKIDTKQQLLEKEKFLKDLISKIDNDKLSPERKTQLKEQVKVLEKSIADMNQKIQEKVDRLKTLMDEKREILNRFKQFSKELSTMPSLENLSSLSKLEDLANSLGSSSSVSSSSSTTSDDLSTTLKSIEEAKVNDNLKTVQHQTHQVSVRGTQPHQHAVVLGGLSHTNHVAEQPKVQQAAKVETVKSPEAVKSEVKTPAQAATNVVQPTKTDVKQDVKPEVKTETPAQPQADVKAVDVKQPDVQAKQEEPKTDVDTTKSTTDTSSTDTSTQDQAKVQTESAKTEKEKLKDKKAESNSIEKVEEAK